MYYGGNFLRMGSLDETASVYLLGEPPLFVILCLITYIKDMQGKWNVLREETDLYVQIKRKH